MTIALGASVLLAPLDLAARYDDIRRLACSHPAFRAAVAAGVDPDDLRQEVLVRLVARQQGRSAWDPRRSSLSKYVWLVTWCVVSNYRRDQRRHEQLELASDTLEGDASTEPDELLDLEEQLAVACAELGLSPYQRALVLAVAAGDLRRDDARVVALGQIVRDRMGVS